MIQSLFRSILPLPLGAVVVLCLFGMGCAAPGDSGIVGMARVDTAVSPGEARQVALETARAEANRQILDQAGETIELNGVSLRQAMAESPYVAACVRRAVRDSVIQSYEFYDDGYARVILEPDFEIIRAAAQAAVAEVR